MIASAQDPQNLPQPSFVGVAIDNSIKQSKDVRGRAPPYVRRRGRNKSSVVEARRRKPASYSCPDCGPGFDYTNQAGLNNHIMSVHEGRVFRCVRCGKPYLHNSSLDRHLRRKNSACTI
ncbi:hypothetical protein BDZ89DRAFT_1074113 [Hymenopellis radicata]|nr:hypothetical protein BDZ89DRAFT_1074113 [Hymenopellis radicata]